MTAFLTEMRGALSRLYADKGAFSAMVLAILLYGFLYPQPYLGEVVREVPVAVVDQDGSTLSRELARRIDRTDAARIVPVTGLPEAKARFFGREVYGLVVIPSGFERDLLDGLPAPVAAYGDAGYFLVYSSMMGAVTNAARSLGADAQYTRLVASGMDAETAQVIVAPVTITSVALFNPQGGYASYIVPAAFVLIMQQTLLMGIGILHTGRRLRGGLAVVATPLTYILLYCLWIAFSQRLLPVIYDLPTLGSMVHLYMIGIPFLLAVTAMGFALAQLLPTREGVIFLLVVMGMPLFFLSGVSWPIESMPDMVRHLALLIPSTTAIPAFVQIDQMGAALSDVSDTIVLQLALAFVYGLAAIGLNALRRRSGDAR